jgi:precorrin-6A/cobalt-precorrin-6A reductase
MPITSTRLIDDPDGACPGWDGRGARAGGGARRTAGNACDLDPGGEVRIGGFGGPDGLASYLERERVEAVVDATHPFAERISESAAAACERAAVALLRLERPSFRSQSGDDWRPVPTLEEAAALIPKLGERVFLTTGRQGLAAFAAVRDAFFLVRCVDRPSSPLPPRHELVLDRGPFKLDGELALFDEHRLDLLVTKDSGGEHTAAKLDAARLRGRPVVMVQRPPRPEAPAAPDVKHALSWLESRVHVAG